MSFDVRKKDESILQGGCKHLSCFLLNKSRALDLHIEKFPAELDVGSFTSVTFDVNL